MFEKLKSLLSSPLVGDIISKSIYIIGGMVVILLIFLSGEAVGYHRAEFSRGMNENYLSIFDDKDDQIKSFPLPPQDGSITNSHGATGIIISIALPSIVIESADGIEKTISVGTTSLIKRFRNTINSADLKINDSIVVLGTPTSHGQIDAKLIRVMPPSQTASSTSNY
jgi:hypothetical protein